MRRVITCAALLCGLWPDAATAGEVEARSLFAQARQLRTEGKCAEAIPIFRSAHETHPDGLGSLRNIAECEEELGRLASARRSWWDLRLAALQSTEAKYAGWDEDARAAHERLGARVPRVTVTVQITPPPPVWVQGRPLDPRLLGTELEFDTGPLRVELREEGRELVVREVVLQEGSRMKIEFFETTRGAPTTAKPPAAPSAPAGEAPPPSTGLPPPSSTGPNALVVLGGAGLALGGAAFVGAAIAAGVRAGALSDLEALCGEDAANCTLPAPAADEALAAKDRGESASTAVTALLVSGGVLAGVGAIVLGVGASQHSETPVAVSIGPGGALLSFRGQF